MTVRRDGEITTADQATEMAVSFVKKYRAFALPLKAVRDDDTWTVELDVGAISVKVATIKIHAKNREILEYDIPR